MISGGFKSIGVPHRGALLKRIKPFWVLHQIFGTSVFPNYGVLSGLIHGFVFE